jgi:hypothetical protein
MGLTSQSFSLPKNWIAVIRRQPLMPLPDFSSTDSGKQVSCVAATQSTRAVLRRHSVFPHSRPFPALQPENSYNLGPASEMCVQGKSFTWKQECFILSQVRALSGLHFLRLSPQSGATIGFPILPLMRLSASFHFTDVASNKENEYEKRHPLQGVTLRTERVDRLRSLPLEGLCLSKSRLLTARERCQRNW